VSWYCPAGHESTHCVTAVAPAGDVMVAGQLSHAAPPGRALYSPAWQAAQDAGGPVKPSLHWHVLVPVANAALAEHIVWHCEAPSMPADEVVPVAQKSQLNSVSWPARIRARIADVCAVLSGSSTAKRLAMSPWNRYLPGRLWPTYVAADSRLLLVVHVGEITQILYTGYRMRSACLGPVVLVHLDYR